MLFICKTLHIGVVFRHSTFKVVQFFNHLTSLCKYSLKKSFWYYIMMMPGSKGLSPHELAHGWVKDLRTRPDRSIKVG